MPESILDKLERFYSERINPLEAFVPHGEQEKVINMLDKLMG